MRRIEKKKLGVGKVPEKTLALSLPREDLELGVLSQSEVIQ